MQAKNENARNQATFQHRRSRKRSWTQSKPDYYQKETSSKSEKSEMPSTTWSQKAIEKLYDNKKLDHQSHERINLNNNTSKANNYETASDSKITSNTMGRLESNYLADNKSDIPTTTTSQATTGNVPMMFPMPNQDNNIMLPPPPPPIWYPPMYPSSTYGIDPLHFFIDLRVSGHIYDRKNGKDAISSSSSPNNMTPTQTLVTEHNINETNNVHEIPMELSKDVLRQSKNSSAFSVPIPSLRNLPINLSNNNKNKIDNDKETKILKFDVKSMGFDKGSNKTSTNYIMSNISNIYKQITLNRKFEKAHEENVKDEIKEETEDEKEKRVKDLRALIGLELVVDYMNHTKPGQHLQNQTSEESSTDFESAGSPAVEVVAIQDDGSSVEM